ncbi:unknown [Mycoplasma sp. CAG:611]|nr:unknown [Mycoplasma sp. CAG:611]
MNNKFLLANEIKNFILSLDSILINYPKKDIIIKKRIINTSFELLELVYLANNKIDNKENIKYECLSKISMIDFYFEYSYKKNYISLKNLNTYIFNLTKINKMLHGWINNEL